MTGKLEQYKYGDYQTPIYFTEKVCAYLKHYLKISPSAVIEPTCGIGNFLRSSLLFQAKEYYGIEINLDYCRFCRSSIIDKRVKIIHSDFFNFSSKVLVQDSTQVLIIGNPPWGTNSSLSLLGSTNLPTKTNFKKFKGIEAITGASNFDICEYIILQLINEYKGTNTIISMLCKTSVARNVFIEMKRSSIPFLLCNVLKFDAKKVFGISADACVFIIKLSENFISSDICNIYDLENPTVVKSSFSFYGGRFYSGFDIECNFDGRCCFEWRQGVKHDCSKVMELTVNNGVLQNGMKENVCIEEDMVFPLIKSSMFKHPIISKFSKFVIVTQKKSREDTGYLRYIVPKTWEYLNNNIGLFRNRKSSIYLDTPPFSMFGVGEYSYSLYKVGVSGFYKQPLFSVLFSHDEKPVMLDDTCYFICFDNFQMAYTAMLLLNSVKVQKFLTGIALLDSKRPYTKKVLERVDFGKITGILSFEDIVETECKLKLSRYITQSIYDSFKSLVQSLDAV